MSSRRTLYKIETKTGSYYVLALDPTAAEKALKEVLEDDGRRCETKSIVILCGEIRKEDKPFHLNTGNEILIVP